jgi:signal transduction histidine kinase
VKNIVKGHGGTVEVESDLGVGATFILHFPFVGKRPVSRGEQHQAVAHVD